MYKTEYCINEGKICQDSNCRMHHSVVLATIFNENDADIIITNLLKVYPVSDFIFKRYCDGFWFVRIDKPINNEIFYRMHEFCNGVKYALNMKI